MTDRITVIAIHFGPLPTTMDLWLRSAAANPDTGFLLVTDQPVAAAANIRVVPDTLAALRARAEALLETPVALTKPYKLCDLRPMYGLLFAEAIGDSAYWGHCDLDMMFGAIRTALPPAAWGFDKILVRGNFSLYRNTPAMNEAFRHGAAVDPALDWRAVLADPGNRLFDEWAGIYRILQGRNVPIFTDEIIADIDRARHGLRRTRAGADIVQELFHWEDGRIVGHAWDRAGAAAATEYLLIHLQKRALAPPSPAVLAAERVYFTPGGFLPGRAGEPVDRARARRINPASRLGDAGILGRRVTRAVARRLAR